MMKLMTPDLAATIPALYSTDGVPANRRKVPVKFFDPCGRFTCFVLEYDGDDTVFAYVVSPLDADCDEYGYVSLAELQSVKGPLGLGIERDIHWDPETTLAAAVPALARQGV